MRCRFILLCAIVFCGPICAEDFFLTIGGGYSPSGNQASLEKNILFYQRLLDSNKPDVSSHGLFFAGGNSGRKDLQVMDKQSLPKATRLMAEFFGSEKELGLSYRSHNIDDVRGPSKPLNVKLWLQETGSLMKSGDRLIMYVTTHGKGSDDRSNRYDTSISMWGNSSLKVSEIVGMLDKLPEGVEVIAVMVQCHAGGFARFIFNEGDPQKGLSQQKRVGFFATVHDRPAAGCTPDVDEAGYVEYSTYFWAAIAGQDRLGNAIDVPDYNKDGRISLSEAHAYTVLTADTIDLPIKSSEEFLRAHSQFQDRQNKELLTDTTGFSEVLTFADDIDQAVLTGLSDQLDLSGEDRLNDAYNKSRGRTSRNRRDTSTAQLRTRIASGVKRRWPELANVLNPLSMQLMTNRSDEFVRALQDQKDYKKYRDALATDESRLSTQEQRVKYERFLRVADNVILAENLKRLDKPERLAQYQALIAAEAQSF